MDRELGDKCDPIPKSQWKSPVTGLPIYPFVLYFWLHADLVKFGQGSNPYKDILFGAPKYFIT